MKPNFAFGLHLACTFCFSLYFMPFNQVSTEQIITLQLTLTQRLELILFLANTALALFLFGGKRPNASLPHSYEVVLYTMYGFWWLIFVFELFHVRTIRAEQRRRQMSLVTAQRDVLEQVKTIHLMKKMSSVGGGGGVMRNGSPRNSSTSFRPLSLQLSSSSSRARHASSQNGGAAGGRLSPPPTELSTPPLAPEAGSYHAAASSTTSTTPGALHPVTLTAAKSASCAVELLSQENRTTTVTSRSNRAMSDSIALELKAILTREELESSKTTKGFSGKKQTADESAMTATSLPHTERKKTTADVDHVGVPLPPLEIAKAIRVFLGCVPIALFLVALYAKLYSKRRVVIGVWAMWPFNAMCLATLFVSSFSKTKNGVWFECLLFILGGPGIYLLTNSFGFDWATESKTRQRLVFVAIIVVSGICFWILLLLRKRIRHTFEDDISIYKILENAHSTMTALSVPVIYLSLESVGWISSLPEEDEEIFNDSRSVVNVNFVASMHLFGVLVMNTYFKPFTITRYDLFEFLKGQFSRRLKAEACLFILASQICLFSLATKVTGRMSYGTSPTNVYKYSILSRIHFFASLVFLFCWCGVFVVEGVWHAKRLNPNLQLENPNADTRGILRGLSATFEMTSITGPRRGNVKPANTSGDSRHSSDDPSNIDDSSRETMMSLSNDVMSSFWRWFIAVIPIGITPLLAIAWLVFPPSSTPFLYLFVTTVPVNILCLFVVFFSQPSLSSSTKLEVTSYVIGGPVSSLIGVLADFRWWYVTNVTTQNGDSAFKWDGPFAFTVMRFIFTVGMFWFTKLLLKFRRLIAENIWDIDRFVVQTICGSALTAFVPVAYICMTSLGCVISAYEDNNYENVIIPPLCMQQLVCNVGVALHLVGFGIFNVFLLKEFIDFDMDQILAFSVPRHVKIDFGFLSISTALSVTLFSFRTFVPPSRASKTMLILACTVLTIILATWAILFVRQVYSVARKVEETKKNKKLRPKSTFHESSSDLSDDDNLNLTFLTGNTTGVSGYSPGLA